MAQGFKFGKMGGAFAAGGVAAAKKGKAKFGKGKELSNMFFSALSKQIYFSWWCYGWQKRYFNSLRKSKLK